MLSLISATLFFWLGGRGKVYVNDHNDCVDCVDDPDGNVIGLREGETEICSTKHHVQDSSDVVINDSQNEDSIHICMNSTQKRKTSWLSVITDHS